MIQDAVCLAEGWLLSLLIRIFYGNSNLSQQGSSCRCSEPLFIQERPIEGHLLFSNSILAKEVSSCQGFLLSSHWLQTG